MRGGHLWWLRPEGKTQVTIEYAQKADGSVEPLRIHTVVISTQHAVPSKAVRSKECAGHSGKYMTAPIMEEMNKLIVSEVIVKTVGETILKNGEPAVMARPRSPSSMHRRPMALWSHCASTRRSY